MREDGEQKHCQGRNLISWRGSVTQHYDDDLQRVVVIIRGLVLQRSKTIGGSQTRCHNHINPADVCFGAKFDDIGASFAQYDHDKISMKLGLLALSFPLRAHLPGSLGALQAWRSPANRP